MKALNRYFVLAGGIGVLILTLVFTNAASVTVNAMKPLLVTSFDEPAIRPFQTRFCLVAGTYTCGGTPYAINVQTVTDWGEPVIRLVIEHVSTRCRHEVGGDIYGLALWTTADGVEQRHHFVPFQHDANHTTAAQPVRLYADPGSELRFERGVTGDHVCEMSVSGHFIVADDR